MPPVDPARKALDGDAALTETSPGTARADESLGPSSYGDHGRFPPGQILASRYRIVGLVGRGGMGEVYRADDLKLGQTVALKFLEAARSRDPESLQAMHHEVRIARQISHPNVCRVYDIGEIEGHPFLSMEYIDGENLAALLRRIGRLSGDKVVELARQLCAGLGAAHELGILHRDLKPSNVMIDGRGRLRITDFGLADVATQIREDEVRAGTPAYMAPEQLAGDEVSTRSDLYSLGLVLYEMCTGKPAFHATTIQELARIHSDSTPTDPSSLVPEIDPQIARVVLRCLAREPHGRPGSALVILALLPGGNPLAAAMAEGHTPSPELVAAAGESGILSPRVAATVFALVVLGILFASVANYRLTLPSVVPLPRPPAALADRSRETLERLGYSLSGGDEAFGFMEDSAVLREAFRSAPGTEAWQSLATVRPSAIQFWYRWSPEPLVATADDAVVRLYDPLPLGRRGMMSVRTDPRGRLIEFVAVPEVDASTQPAAGVEPDWPALLRPAGLDGATLATVAPQRTPMAYCDTRAAWEGAFPDQSDVPLRIEAGATGQRPSYLRVLTPRDLAPPTGSRSNVLSGISEMADMLVWLLGLPGAAVLAWWNLRMQRGDRRGATRLSGALLVLFVLRWLLQADHVIFPFGTEIRLMTRAAGIALFHAAWCWMLYVALEPFVRRWWPQALIGWSRFLTGRLRDPLVGRDILYGALLGLATNAVVVGVHLLPHWLGWPVGQPFRMWLDSLGGINHVAASLLSVGIDSLVAPMVGTVVLLFARVLLRKEWAALAAACLIYSLFGAFGTPFAGEWGWAVNLATNAALMIVWVLALTRFGLLVMISGFFFGQTTARVLICLDPAQWYTAMTLLTPLVLLGLATYAFWTALAGRSVLGEVLSAR